MLNGGGTTLRALVVDYDEATGGVLVSMLGKTGTKIEADLVGWLQSAIQSATIRRYDVVFLGLHLPNGQGIDAARQFMLRVPLVPVVVVADVFDPEVAEQCTLHGAQGYLVKGSATPELLEIMTLTAISRQERDLIAKQATRCSLLDDNAETPTATSPKLVKAHVAELNAAVREVQTYLASDAPAHAAAVRSIFNRRHLGALTHEIGQYVELDGERFDDETPVEGLRARKSSETALRVLRRVIDRRSDVPPSTSESNPTEAEATLMDVIDRRSRFASGTKT